MEQSKTDFHGSHAGGSGTDEGTGYKPGVPDVPKYDFDSDKESWGNNEEEDDDNVEESDDQDNDDDNDDDDMNDDEETDSERTKSDRDENPDPNLTNEEQTEQEEEEYNDQRVYTSPDYQLAKEEKIDDEEKMDEEDEDEVTKELYTDMNVNLGTEDTEMKNTAGTEHSTSVSSNFTSKLLNLDNPSHDGNEIASLMDTSTVPPPPPPVIPSPHHSTITQQQTPHSTTTTTTSPSITLPEIPDFASLFRFDQRVSNLETKMSEFNQTSQVANAVSSIPGIVDNYLASKMKEQAIIKEQVQYQVSKIMPHIEKYVTKTLEGEVLVRSTNQPQTSYAVGASLSEHELKKILIDKMESNKSKTRSDIQRNLYNVLVEAYNSNKDILTSYGDVVTLKIGRDDQDKDKDPSAGSDRETKRRKSSKDAESSKDSRSKEKMSSKEASHSIEDSGVQQDQEFDTGANDEQPADTEVTKDDWFKKPERPPTLNSDWDKRQLIESRQPQTWISDVAHAEEPPTSFDEFNYTLFDFSAFIINRIKIPNLTQEILVGPAFNLLKGTCKSLTKLEYHFEEYHRGRQVIPQDFFINNDLEYLKGGELSRRYLTSVTKTKDATYGIKWIKYMIEARRDDQTFKEGDFLRLRLQDIEDMILLLVQRMLLNLTINERFDLNVALRMYTRRIVIKKRVEDLQLDV
ncbi:hypothetical protein Tco_0450083 [Tanacetum coccineum]